MNITKNCFILSFVLLLCLPAAAQESNSWIELINPELFGVATGEKDNWTYKSNCLVGTTEAAPTIIRTTTQFGQYNITVRYALSGAAKASLLLKTDPAGKRCLEIPLKASEKGIAELNLTAQQISAQTKLGRGFIGIKLYEGSICVYSLNLQPENMKPLFNGKDLTGWKKYDVVDAAVNEKGEMTVQNGNGALESADSFADFELSLDVFVNGDDLNSGVFFRCIPGEKMNGYECQVHFGYLDGDRTKPQDCGTGGIFRRVNARKVLGDNKTWNRIYINAVGNHIAVWVNGVQVTDWSDTRKPNPNPRKGLRTEAGTIQLQAHDPTTNLLFRNIRAGAVPVR